MKLPLRALLVEDSPDDAELTLRELRRAGYDLRVERVETRQAMAAALDDGPWDVILCDYSMPHFSARAALETLKEAALDVPLIIVSGAIGEDTAVEMMRAGAHDYVMKDRLARLAPAIERELAEAAHRRKRREAEQALAESEEKYRRLFAAESDAVAVFDAETRRLLDVNAAALNMYGYTRDEFLSLEFADISADPQRCEANIQHVIAQTSGHLPVGYHTKKDGTVFPVEISASSFILKGRQVICGVIRDTSEREKAEKDLRFFRDVLDQSNDGVLVVEFETGCIVDANDSACMMLGHRRDQLLSARIHDTDPQMQDQAFAENVFGRLERDGSVLFESIAHPEDGRKIPVEISARLVQLAGDRYLLAIGRDITERKAAEAALRDSEEQFRQIADNVRHGMWVQDARAMKMLYVSPACAQIFGRTVDDLINDSAVWHEVIHPEDVREPVPPARQEATESVYRVIHKDGDVRWVNDLTVPVRNEDGQLIRNVGIVEDITRRKRAEEEIENLAKFPSENPDPVLRVSADGTVLYANATSEGLLAALGSGVGQPAPDVWRDRVSWSLEERAPWREAMTHGGRIFSFSGVPVPAGGYVNLYGHDVTDRRQAEDQLRLLSSRQEAILASVPDIIMEVNEQKVYTWANPAGLEFFGPDVLGKEAAYYFEGEQDTYDVVQPLFDGSDDVIYVESWQRRRDGAIRLLAWWCRVLKDSRGCVTGTLATARDITDRKRAEEEAEAARRQTEQVLRSSPAVIYGCRVDPGCGPQGPYPAVFVSPSIERILGVTPEQCLSDATWWPTHIHPEDVERVFANMRRLLAEGTLSHEYRILHKDGSYRWVRDDVVLTANVAGTSTEFVGSWTDITERKQAEAQFLQAQKMEAVGQLAGGVAHDFRNQLTVIKGLTEMLRRRDMVKPEGLAKIDQILQSVDRSVRLTGQLLAFSRKELLEPRAVDLADMIADLGKSLPRVIGEDVRLSISRGPAACMANVDPGLFHQALVNLVINARDAMPEGGTVFLETDLVELDAQSGALRPGTQPGRYASVLVKDTGVGMAEDVRHRVFEPFFTTKAVGQGTGLGLAMVYGFVKQSGGHIECASAPGRGTTFTILLPWTSQAASAPGQADGAPSPPPSGSEHVLVVEDEALVREMVVASLREGGYQITAAASPAEALAVTGQQDIPIDLVVTDVVMPDMNGASLAEHIRAVRPNVRILFISGYPRKDLARRGADSVRENLLLKPFSHDQLLRQVRAAIDST